MKTITQHLKDQRELIFYNYNLGLYTVKEYQRMLDINFKEQNSQLK